jgi:hypothetical protein
MDFQDLPLDVHLNILSFLHRRHNLSKWRSLCVATSRSLQGYRDHLDECWNQEYSARRTMSAIRPSTQKIFYWWLHMRYRDDDSAINAGVKLFTTAGGRVKHS